MTTQTPRPTDTVVYERSGRYTIKHVFPDRTSFETWRRQNSQLSIVDVSAIVVSTASQIEHHGIQHEEDFMPF